MLKPNRLHLIPEIVKNRAESLLREGPSVGRNHRSEREQDAQVLEAIVEYCNEALGRYGSKKRAA